MCRVNMWQRTSVSFVSFAQGRMQELKKGGGGHNTLLFFSDCLESRASPQKADEAGGGGGGGGGSPTLFPGSPPASKVAQVPNKLMSKGGGGESDTCTDTCFF